MTLFPQPDLPCRLLKTTPEFWFLTKPHRMHSIAHDLTERDTVANWLVGQDPIFAHVGSPLESGLIHRLDFATSGVMAAARTPEALAWARELFAQKRVEKIYVCDVVHEVAPGTYRAFAGKHPKSARRVKVANKTFSTARPITTQVLSCVSHDGFHRLTIQIPTGYRHQIRAHLAFLGAPILGDDMYRGVPAERLHLHAQKIAFPSRDGTMIGAEKKCQF